MTEESEAVVLGKTVRADNQLDFKEGNKKIRWRGGDFITLEGLFSAAHLESISWWIQNVKVTKPSDGNPPPEPHCVGCEG